MLKKILKSKHIATLLYVISLGLVLLLNSEVRYKSKSWLNTNQDITALYSEANCFFLKQKYNEVFQNAKDFSIVLNQLNAMTFLNREKQLLKEHLENPNFIENESFQGRFNFLNSPHLNKMSFSQKISDNQTDVVTEMNNPVELDLEDLEEFLCIIENSLNQRIPYFITDLELKRKQTISKQEIWKLNYKLLKRSL